VGPRRRKVAPAQVRWRLKGQGGAGTLGYRPSGQGARLESPNVTATPYVLSIDLGSSGVKVGLVDASGTLRVGATERYGLQVLPDGGAEQDARQWWEALVRCCRRVLAEAGVPPEAVAAVGCTSQWSATVAVDAEAEPLAPVVSWMDTRGGKYNRALVDGFPSVQGYGLYPLWRWIRAAGVAPTQSGVDALGHMLFLKHERPDVYARAHKLLEPMDFVTFRLTGRSTASRSTAFPTMLADVTSPEPGRYHPWLLARSQLDEAKLGELIPGDAVVGPLSARAAAELGLSTRAVVLSGVPDNHSSAIGAGAVKDHEAVAVLGTSGFLGCHLPHRGLDMDSFITTLPSPLPGRHLIFGDLGNNGKVLDSMLDRQLYSDDELAATPRPFDAYQRLDEVVARVPPGSDGVLFLPWFNGSLCPREDAAMRGGYLNLTHRTTRAHLARAMLEGLSFNWRWLLGAAEKFAKVRFPLLRLAGGGARSAQWAQVMADVTGRPMHQQADPPNGNVLGMAYLLLRHLGLLALDDIPRLARVARVFEPRPEHTATYDRGFEHFLKAEKALRPVFHGLNRRA
jgi:xylulokinase